MLSLEVGLIIRLFGRIRTIVIGTLLGLMTCVTIGSGLSNGAREGFPLIEQDFDLKVVGYCHDVHIITVLVDISSKASHFYSLQCSHFGKNDYFSPPMLCIATFSTIETIIGMKL